MKAFSRTGLVFSATTKLAVTLCSNALAMAAFAQGVVNFNNTSATLARTNALGLGSTAGPTSPSGLYYYALFTAPSAVTNVNYGLDLLTPTWTFTELYGTNTAATTGGRLSGGFSVTVPTGWPPGVTNSFVVAGWSANVGGSAWSAVATQLAGASLNGGVWSGPNWLQSSQAGFFGVSSLGTADDSPANSEVLQNLTLFGPGPNYHGLPITSGFDMFAINTPEPSVLALACLGGTMLMSLIRARPGVPGTSETQSRTHK